MGLASPKHKAFCVASLILAAHLPCRAALGYPQGSQHRLYSRVVSSAPVPPSTPTKFDSQHRHFFLRSLNFLSARWLSTSPAPTMIPRPHRPAQDYNNVVIYKSTFEIFELLFEKIRWQRGLKRERLLELFAKAERAEGGSVRLEKVFGDALGICGRKHEAGGGFAQADLGGVVTG
ncbi:hypothetical protein KSP40_PGU020711 [Platanthera guangdongensis]|uniref:Uncharacterized protein n=1 Tax=Platanthera guangdongensis TaxID=2320717 RepID=A0ABR2MMS2_9ASPA